MRKFPLLSASFLALTMIAGCPSDDGGDDSTSNADSTAGDENGENDNGENDNGSEGSECFEAPELEICERFIACLDQIAPGQGASQVDKYGPDGSCWCNSTEEEALECLSTCQEEIAKALVNFPTANACHESYCTLDELDPAQPYGLPEGGSCADFDWNGAPYPQIEIANPLGVPGTFCSPACSGIANACPDSSQTSAEGTCFIAQGDTNYCISRCYVDSTVIGGTQCQCGATCQPYGGPDGEGNMRGICTFE